MSLIVKICGVKSVEALDAALEAGADMVGFVFFAPSPRHLDLAAAAALGSRTGDRALKVALSVDAGDAELAASIEALKPDLLQLHGNESPARARAIRQTFGLPLIKAIAVLTQSDLALASAYVGIADHILFDARAPRDATRPGGLGRAFEWRLMENATPPFMVSGGLDAGNIAQALRVTRAAGVDVSSGVERAVGEKDPDKIRAFVRAARQAQVTAHDPDQRGEPLGRSHAQENPSAA